MPELSVIIPTHNRAAKLRVCLEALSRQTVSPADFDVIVVNDGSTDDTTALLAQLETPFALRAIDLAQRGQCAARNAGAEIANRICLFLDDDIIPSPELVAAHLKAQQAHQGAVVIGPLTTRLPDDADWANRSDWYARRFAKEWAAHYARLDRRVRPLRWRDCYSGNMSVPREVLLTAGGFAVDLAAEFDVELGYRLQQCGVPMVYAPAAQGDHDDDKPAHRLIHDDVGQGRMWPELVRRHPALLPEILQTFWDTSPRSIWLRKRLLSMGLAPQRLLKLKPLFQGEHWTTEWFRFIRAYAFWFGVRQALPDALWQQWMSRTPILMYHAFGTPGEKRSRYVVPAQRFEQQMAWLKRNRYQVLSLSEFVTYQTAHRRPPARSVVITIDDAYTDVKIAQSILRRYGFPATIFVVSDCVGDANRWDQAVELSGRRLLDWSDLKALARDGVEIGAHTRTHPHLRSMTAEEARAEIEGSRVDLERELGVPIRTFAYPYGEYTSASEAIVQKVGFQGSCGVTPEPAIAAISPYSLPRIEIRGTDSLLDFVFKLRWGRGVRGTQNERSPKRTRTA